MPHAYSLEERRAKGLLHDERKSQAALDRVYATLSPEWLRACSILAPVASPQAPEKRVHVRAPEPPMPTTPPSERQPPAKWKSGSFSPLSPARSYAQIMADARRNAEALSKPAKKRHR